MISRKCDRRADGQEGDGQACTRALSNQLPLELCLARAVISDSDHERLKDALTELGPRLAELDDRINDEDEEMAACRAFRHPGQELTVSSGCVSRVGAQQRARRA